MHDFRPEKHRVNRLVIVAMTAVSFIVIVGMLAALIFQALSQMTTTANLIDDNRAMAATNGALDALQRQLSATVRDNAYWDDAFQQVNSGDPKDWIFDNWGSTTENYPLYDTMLIVEGQDTAFAAYHNGLPFENAFGFFDSSLAVLIRAAREPDPERTHLPVSFITTKEGAALVGAAAIQPFKADPKADLSKYKVLVFSKLLTPQMLAEVAANFSIKGLTLGAEPRPAMLNTPLRDMLGREIAFFNWPAEKPGTLSFQRVKPLVVAAAAVLVLLLTGICCVGYLVVRSVRREERMARFNATHDALTGLWNRSGLLAELDRALRTTDFNTHGVTLRMLDLDGFKAVNDAWGHPIGDRLIRAVSDRLTEALPRDAVIARLGGDEFSVLTVTPQADGGRDRVSETLGQLFREPFIIEGRTIEIGGSTGVASATAERLETHELLRRSDVALYRAKDLGRGVVVEFDPSFDADASEAAALEQELRQSLANGEVELEFQPLIEANGGTICGVEALARWTSPTRGRIGPDVFIGVAERSGLIDQLGAQVLEKAVGAAAAWPGIGLAINISPIQLKNPFFVTEVTRILSRFDFDPRRLTVEVTEGVLISNPDQAKRAFAALKMLGVKIALDDFGCGYASIGALRTFGFDRMKIDRSLVVAVDADENAGAVLQATIALANALRLPVTAEGIETESQATAVKLSGCDELQGFLYSEPLAASELTSRYFPSEDARKRA